MPRYRFPGESLRREEIPRGTIDSIWFSSTGLARHVRVLVYLPPGYHADAGRFPVLYVMDGGEYLALAHMNVVLDNLIAGGTIASLIAVFVDPRKDPDDPRTNERMREYALNDRFVGTLAGELRPFLLGRYRMRKEAAHTAIMGASMGGLIATYAALTRPGVFGLCAAQSPSFQWANDTLLTMLRRAPGGTFRMFLSTGTMHDAERRARIARDIMREKGYDITYVETPEAHNWANWRGRLQDLLTAFWGTR
jgi:enterochelin esterase family protein